MVPIELRVKLAFVEQTTSFMLPELRFIIEKNRRLVELLEGLKEIKVRVVEQSFSLIAIWNVFIAKTIKYLQLKMLEKKLT